MNPLESSLVLVNPSRNPARTAVLEARLKNAGFPAVRRCESKTEYLDAVRSFMESPLRFLIVSGGDGTVNDAVNGMMAFPAEIRNRKALGFFRGGSGNGYQDSYLIPEGIDAQIRTFVSAMRNESRIAVDLLRFETPAERGFCQLAGTGFDAKVLEIRETRKVRWRKNRMITKPGIASYVRAIVLAFFNPGSLNPQDFALTLGPGTRIYRDGRMNARRDFDRLGMHLRPSMIEAGKRPYYARSFKICPDAISDGGRMSVYLYNLRHRGKVLLHFADLWRGRHRSILDSHPVKDPVLPVEQYDVESLVIESPEPFAFHVDGELKHTGDGPARLSLEVERDALRFLVPEHYLVRSGLPSGRGDAPD